MIDTTKSILWDEQMQRDRRLAIGGGPNPEPDPDPHLVGQAQRSLHAGCRGHPLLAVCDITGRHSLQASEA